MAAPSTRASTMAWLAPFAHYRAAPVDGWLRGVHLRPDHGVDAVGCNQQRAADLAGGAAGVLDAHAHASIAVFSVAGHSAPQPDRLRPDPLQHLFVQQHGEPTATHR